MMNYTDVICLDISILNLIKAKLMLDVDFIVSDAENLSIRNEFFDKIFTFEILENLPDPLKFLKESYRILKKKGALVTPQQHRQMIM